MNKLIRFNFNREYSKGFPASKTEFGVDEMSCKYLTTPKSRMTGYHTDTILAEAIGGFLGIKNSPFVFVGQSAVGPDGSYTTYVSYDSDSYAQCGTIFVYSLREGGEIPHFRFIAGQYDYKDKHMNSYDVSKHKGTALVLAMLPEFMQDSEFKNLAVSAIHAAEDGNTQTLEKDLCALVNQCYYRLKDNKSTAPIETVQEITDQILESDLRREDHIFQWSDNVDSAWGNLVNDLPEPAFSSAPVSAAAASTATPVKQEDIFNKYPLDPNLVVAKDNEVHMPDWYVTPAWVGKIAHAIAATHGTKNPVQNILLFGGAGSGKSLGSNAIASMLGCPKHEVALGPDDGRADILYQELPNPDKSKVTVENLPTFDDVENDFAGTFVKLFGREPGKLDTPSQCYEEINKRLLAAQASNDFIFTETEVMKAIREGGVIEVQEANNLKRPAVLEVLNPILNGDGCIALPTGEKVYRHPDCIFIFTVNRDYEGTSALQEAVYSRINLVVKVDEPTSADMFVRTKAALGFKDGSVETLALEKMSDMVAAINSYCKDKDICGGVCGPRELLDWATMATVEADGKMMGEEVVIRAAFETVLQKAAQNKDDMEDIINGCFNLQYSPSVVKKYLTMI